MQHVNQIVPRVCTSVLFIIHVVLYIYIHDVVCNIHIVVYVIQSVVYIYIFTCRGIKYTVVVFIKMHTEYTLTQIAPHT